MTPVDGWALTFASLLITHDDGAHWSDVTPAQAKPAYGFTGDGIKGVTFTDAQHGWVAIAKSYTSPYSATVTVLQTSDGGRDWHRRANVSVGLQYCLCRVIIDAVGPATLWLDIDVGTKADGWGRVVLERSTDGGWTWQQVVLPTSGDVLFSDAFHGVVAGGAPNNGFFTAVPNTVAPFYATSDGGVSWAPSTFSSSPPLTPSPDGPDPSANYAVNRGLAVAYVQNVISASKVYVFSSPYGSTWSPVVTLSAGDLPELTVVTHSTWFLSDLEQNATEPRLRVTTDSGATWRSVTPVPGPVPGNTGVGFAFADPNSGWAYASTSYCLNGKTDCGAADHLYATSDGGATWSSIVVPGPAST